MKAIDEDGDQLHVITWKTHNVSQQWVEGREYELEGARGKRYSTQSGDRVEIHSTTAFQAREVSQTAATRICVVGDTHVGYRHRPRSNKASWSYDVDNRETFTKVLRRARNQNVDAVIHAGDIFDHETTQSDLDTVHEEVTRTCEQGIAFYFVQGNHDKEAGRRLLKRLTAEQSECIRLTTEETSISGKGESLNAYGYDHSGAELPSLSPDHRFHTLGVPEVLVIHDTPFPVVDEQNVNIYSPEQLDLRDFLTESTVTPDLIIAGHLHVGSEGTVRDHDVPVLTTGPTAPISDSTEDNDPSTWLLTVTGDSPEISRQPL
ncbi:metallophosphoesterase family protein [Natronomonas halophila]|nr:metallophosphoesterase family protein [Natronomonas halophila]